MKTNKLFLLLFICFTCYSQDNNLISLVSIVKQSILNFDSLSFTATLSDKYFDYFEGDLEIDPSTVDSNFYKLLPSGYYGKELSEMIDNKIEIINLFTKESTMYPRNKCVLTLNSFSPLKKISSKRYEIVIKRLYDAYNMHLVFINQKIGWKLSGSFFEAANTAPCDWNGNVWTSE